jgi:preprotein translocase subunit SecE
MIETYKKGQGVVARRLAFGALLALVVFGTLALQQSLEANEVGWAVHELPVGVHVSAVLTAGMIVAAIVAIIWLLNTHRLADYLINSEAELRKVSWPTRAELKRQTIVVLVFMGFFGFFLLIADVAFAWLNNLFYGGA